MKFLEDHPELELLSQALSFQSPSIKVGTRIEALSCKPVAKEKKQFRTLENDLASDMELSASISPPEDGTPTLQSVFGPLDKRNNRKTFWHLISTLNLAFPDFDFTNVPADDFAREPSASTVLASLSSALNHLRTTSNIGPSHGVYRSFSSYNPVAPSYTNGEGSPEDSANPLPEGDASKVTTHPYLREILDPIIDLDNCEVYSYMPDIESDPHAAESELGSVAASEAGDEDTDMGSQTPLDDGTLWSMEGVPSTPASPIVPETLQDQTRTLRSGQAYFTNSQARRFGRGRGRVRSALAPRSRSQTPHPYGDEESTGGLLWSCHYFFYNRNKKRILFLSHHMRRLSPMGATELEGSISTMADGFFAPRKPRKPGSADLTSSLKRRHSNTSVASQILERRSKRLK